jgi:lysylphosphatidylglycerol synthetase-like protein (DUF2156 family)
MLPPTLQLKPSRWLLIWLVTLHLLAVGAVIYSGLAWAIRLPLLLVLLAGGTLAIRREWRRSGQQLVPVTLTQWQITSINGTEEVALRDALVFRHLVILYFSYPGKRWSRPVLVAEDAVSTDTHRRLRAVLNTLPPGAGQSR